ncbi:MAG: transglycosylase SLT domain-containing protein [Pseudoxanthomonas sp.]
MPRVPVYRTNPTFQAAQAPNLQVAPNRFAEAAARTLPQIGGAVIQKLQEKQAEDDKAALLSFHNELQASKQELLNNADTGFLAQQGANAAATQPGYQDRWQKAQRDALATVPARLRKQAGAIAAQFNLDWDADVQTHIRQQDNTWKSQVAAQTQQTTISEAMLHFDDDMRVGASATSAATAAGLEAGRLGLPQDVARQQAGSAVWAAALLRQMQDDPVKAEARYHRLADGLSPDARVKIEQALVPYLQDQQGQADADWASNGGQVPVAVVPARGTPSAPVKQALDAAAKKYSVPANVLYALAEQESGFDPNAVNPEALDDGDHATGLFQYRASTANGLGGFDRKNAAASADAAAKQLRERMDKGGLQYAIAAHFAGDAGADAVVNKGQAAQNPRTALYLRQVEARAAQWQDGAQALPVAVSEADALERLQQLPPARRKVAEGLLRDRWDIQKLRQQAADAQTSTELFQQVAQAPADMPLNRLLTPDQMLLLARDETLNSAIGRYRKMQAQGQVVEDDPVTVDKLALMQANDPNGFRQLNLMQYVDKLSGKTILALTNAQKEGQKNPEKLQQWASEGQLLSLAQNDMGLVGEDNAAKRGQFATQYYREKRTWMEQNGGKEPDADQMQTIINKLKLPFVKASFFGFGGGTRRAFEGGAPGYQVPDDERRKIVAEAKANGVPNPSEAQIVARYLDKAGDSL